MNTKILIGTAFVLFSISFVVKSLVVDVHEDKMQTKLLTDKENVVDEQFLARDLVPSPNVIKLQGLEKKVITHVEKKSKNVDPIDSSEVEFRRIVAKETRDAKITEIKRYGKERKKWRQKLHQARLEANKSGDYTKYNAIRASGPKKRKGSE